MSLAGVQAILRFYFDWALNTFLGQVLQKVHFASQVRLLRGGFNEK